LWRPQVEKKKIDKYEMHETKLENAKLIEKSEIEMWRPQVEMLGQN